MATFGGRRSTGGSKCRGRWGFRLSCCLRCHGATPCSSPRADLDILPAGPPSHRAAELLGDSLAQLLEEAAAEYDLVVLDAPPFLGFAEPLEMATAVDGVVVVTRAGRTTRKAVAAVLGTLHRLRANTLGIVLNEVHSDNSESYYSYANYARYYGTANERIKQNA